MNEHFVINIGRQLGSGGRTVGEIIARRLGVKLYDKELINLAARESGICPEFFEKADEKESRGVISTVVGYLRAPFVGDDGGVTNVLSNDALFKIQSDVIRAVAARESAVFVGRFASFTIYPLNVSSSVCFRRMRKSLCSELVALSACTWRNLWITSLICSSVSATPFARPTLAASHTRVSYCCAFTGSLRSSPMVLS